MPNNRLPRAAKALVEAAQAKHKNAKITAEGDPDGFGVYRSVKFDKTSSKFVADALEELGDERVADVSSKGGHTVVTFVAGAAADRRTPFPLSAAKTVKDDK